MTNLLPSNVDDVSAGVMPGLEGVRVAKPVPANRFDPWMLERDDPVSGTVSPIRVGRHVLVRPMNPADFEWIYQVAVMTSAGNHWRMHGNVPTMEEFARLLNTGAQNTFIIAGVEDSAPIGMVQTFAWSMLDRHAQITALFHPAMHGRGWPLEGVLIYLDYIFTVFSLRKIYLETTSEELVQFGSVLTSVMTEEGCLKGHRRMMDHYTDVHYLALYRDGFLKLADRVLPDEVRLTRSEYVG